jgi:hypothetical protein
LINKKYFSVKEKFNSVLEKFFFYFRQKIFSRNYEKIRNIMLFINYIKFNSQTFDCYIFYFEFVFQFYLLEFDLI